MPSNGCGGAGEISTVWRMVRGKPPPWEGCCDQHDLAYDQGGPAHWRDWPILCCQNLVFQVELANRHP